MTAADVVRLHYSDGVWLSCPDSASPHKTPAATQTVCPLHGQVVPWHAHDVTLGAPAPDPRECTRCHIRVPERCADDGPYVCADCLEVVDRDWVRVLHATDLPPAPVQLGRPVGERPRLRDVQDHRWWVALYIADGDGWVPRHTLARLSGHGRVGASDLAGRWVERGWVEAREREVVPGGLVWTEVRLTPRGRVGVAELVASMGEEDLSAACSWLAAVA